MTKIVENYILMEVVGKGEFGEVYMAKHTQTEEFFAIKMLNFDKFIKSPKLQELIINEVQSLKKINHPHVLKFYKLLKTSNHIYLVYEYCQNGSLEDILKKKTIISENEALSIFKQIIDGFKIIHSFHIVHQDIKPSNLLFGQNMDLKIADFGFCKILPNPNSSHIEDTISKNKKNKTTQIFGSPIYMAPEVMEGAESNTNQDIYSLGVLLYEMLYGICPFEDNNFEQLLQSKSTQEVKFLDNIQEISQNTKQLLLRMLDINPLQRIEIETIYNHFFEEKGEVNFEKYTENEKGFQNTQPLEVQQNDEEYYQREQIERISIKHEFGFDQLDNNNNNNKIFNKQVSLQETDLQLQQKNFQKLNLNNNNNNNQKLAQINKTLILQRNKVVYISNIICAIMDLNLNIGSAKSSFFLLKKMLQICNQIIQMLSDKQGLKICDLCKIQLIDWQQYYQSEDFSQFYSVMLEEQRMIKQNLLNFMNLIKVEIKDIDDLKQELLDTELSDTQLYLQSLRKYTLSVKQEADQYIQNQNIDLGKRLYIHVNNVLDCIELDKFFQHLLQEKYLRINQQPYFKVIGGFDHILLRDFVDSKLIQNINNN